MKKKITNNWVLKIASLIFAFCLWLIVINIEDPTNDQTFSNITVKFENTDIVTEDGKVYEILDGTGVIKNVTVTGLRSAVEQLKAEDIVAKANFDNLTEDNTIPIEFSVTRFSDKIQRVKGNISNVKLNIEEEKTIRLVLRINQIGEVAEGYMVGTITTDQNQIVVTGAESVVSTIEKAMIDVDVTDASTGIATYADVKLYDAEGKQIQSAAINQKTTSVRVGVEILGIKEVPLEYAVTGTPASGYQKTGEIESDPHTVLIAGNPSVLNNISKIEIPAEEINIAGQSEDVLVTVNIKKYLPSNVILADSSFSGKASVTVYILETVKEKISINSRSVKVNNVPQGYTATLEGLDDEFDITLMGLISLVSQVETDNIIGYVDVKEFMEDEGMEELEAGTYNTKLQFSLPEGISIERSIPVKLVVEKSEE